jgi:NADH-dependent peroxiredoxin subunit F
MEHTMAEQPTDQYDVVVIGGGPAGSAASIYAARQGLTTAVVAVELGGSVQWASKIGNYLGFGLISGEDLARHFREHVAAFDIVTFGGHVDALVPGDDGFEVYTREGRQLTGRAVIIATGRAPARLAVPGEADLIGRGVSYCATCDGAFFRGRPAAVVGPGEAAVDAALQLAALEANVLLVSEKPLRAPATLLAKLEAYDGVDVRVGPHVTRIVGEEQVTAIGLQEGEGEEEVVPVDAVFVETGSVPAEQLTGGIVKVNEAGEIEVDRNLMTSRPGVFAAGDITDQLGKQAIIAAGDGARAGVAAAKWLRER